MTFSNCPGLLLFIFSIFIPLSHTVCQTELNRQHKFEDGIYLSAFDFRHDSPSIPPEEYTYEENENSSKQLYQRQLYHFKLLDGGKYLSKNKVKQIWGICIDGIPYINQNNIIKNAGQDEFVNLSRTNDKYTFTQIVMIGAICTITAEGYKNRIYTPTGDGYDIFGNSDKKFKTERKILKLKTGELVNLNAKNLKKLIEDDTKLLAQFKKDKRKNLDEYVIIYNQRNLIYLK